MKNKFTLLSVLFFLISNIVFSQTKFNEGFDTGYKKGYCQDQGVGCLPPIPPIAPIPKIGESSESYTDGYNRGFEMGLSARKSNNSSSTNSTTRTRYQTAQPKFIDFASDETSNTDIVNLKIKAISVISERAKENLSKGNYDAAIEDGNSLLNVQPNLALGYYVKSVAYYYKDRLIDAYNLAVKSDRSRGKNTEWGTQMFTEMQVYYKNMMANKQYSNVVYTSENIWTPNDLTNYFHGLGYYFQGDYKQAKKYLKKVKNFESAEQYLESIKNEKYYPNPFITQNSQTNQTSQATSNSSQNDDLLAIQNLLKNNKYEEGISLIDKTLKNQDNILLYGIRGTANYLLKNYGEAISDITKSAKTNSEIKPDFLFYRALAKSELGDFQGAVSDYDLIIASGNSKGQFYDMATVYNNKAYTLVGLKQYAKAIPFVTKAIELDKSKWYIWDTRAEIYYYTAEYGKAINDASKAIQLLENANSLYIRGMAHIKLKEKDLGCKDLSRAGELGKKEAYDEIKKSCN